MGSGEAAAGSGLASSAFELGVSVGESTSSSKVKVSTCLKIQAIPKNVKLRILQSKHHLTTCKSKKINARMVDNSFEGRGLLDGTVRPRQIVIMVNGIPQGAPDDAGPGKPLT